jgi:hypothetical protein
VVDPYIETKLNDNQFLRTFSTQMDDTELKWHQDWEDREVEFVNRNDWMVQIDNELPRKCEGSLFIKANVWHRLIKGSSELVVKITKYPPPVDI